MHNIKSSRPARKTIFCFLLIVFALFYAQRPIFAASETFPSLPQGPTLASAAWILFEPESGRTLAEHNADEVRSPASTTKIMTALLAIENLPPDTQITASRSAIDRVGPFYLRAGILPGETLTLRSLLELFMITSSNEAGFIIAEHLSPDGTVAGFSDMMNQRAIQLGIPAGQSQFTNPSGLEEESHFSTARSLAIIAAEAMKHELFREIVSMTSVSAPDTNLRLGSEWVLPLVVQTNDLVAKPALYSSNLFTATGMKTGFTTPAGRCLVSSGINPDGQEYIAVILGAESSEILFRESKSLLEFGFSSFAKADLRLSGEYFDRFTVVDAEDEVRVTVNTLGSVSWLMPTDPLIADAIVTELAILPETLHAPILKGQVLGELQIAVLSTTIGSVQLVAANDVAKSRWAEIRDGYLELLNHPVLLPAITTIVAVLVFFILLRAVLRTISRRRNRRRYHNARRNNHRIDYFR